MTILTLALAFMGGFLVFYRDRPVEQKIPADNYINNQPTNAKQNWESKINEQGGVTATITPIDILSPSSEWKFDIEMNTHSVELKDPMLSTVLIDNEGKEYKPTSWNGPVEGHHMNGVLTFNQIVPTPKFITLKVKNAGDIIRSFTW
ncbi:MAG: hypothetical protein UW07_C0016G0015 [Candidatus Nomurabacteria bacterium GW2011_GWF2_43_8]|uniref:Uncharacterized protein n=3 Tax=Candidatus Nomuraibacteriota TaxID=1752729 RepID=A0A0G1FQP3_9BACT|nr:MAG: hypothetical protein UV76_C0022G0008 [Candidatus Nomurabacteria bacterium GW2011_GWA2_43_15]KKT18997.1 MAG: hypothetical protein UW02_C0017G0011 [Candidatus Nomurabacteria bacterium GW2011_GWB1_43_7]KKT24393.1 MAG: hypothetical protein UW07_C0016G0015 [Candidatus Nomurabacteria bacterium GW2011_GWF2_43_8]